MDEYFPVKYDLKFTQYDYQDLLVKLNELHNKDLLVENSKKVKKNYDAKFNNTKKLRKNNRSFQLMITVIMATHNAERTLPGAIESILSQTFENFEFLIMNDGSTDSTQKILNNYALG